MAVSDHLTYLRGKNQLDLGYSLNHDSISNNNPGTFYGQYIFLSLQAFALASGTYTSKRRAIQSSTLATRSWDFL